MAFKTTFRKHWALLICSWVLLTVLAAEAVLQVKWRKRHGIWKFHQSLFVSHPLLVGIGRPSTHWQKGKISITHNEQGLRNLKSIGPKREGTIRIAVLGGSTTYGTQVSDEKTWAVRLESLLGEPYEVFNLGIPGYGTAENLIQTAFHFSELRPDIAIYYEGWNDLRNAGDKNLKSDYSDFHLPSQLSNLSLATPFKKLALPDLLAQAWRGGSPPSRKPIDWTKTPDHRAIEIYRRNLDLISALCKAQGVTAIFVPQVLNTAAYFRDYPGDDWTPFVADNQIPLVAKDYADAMMKSATSAKIWFVQDVLKAPFEKNDFLDKGHFSPSGHEKFARVLSHFLQSKKITASSKADISRLPK